MSILRLLTFLKVNVTDYIFYMGYSERLSVE